MKYSIVPSPDVEAELEETFQWIARDSPVNAIKWYNGCLGAIETLAMFPQRCGLTPESEEFGYEIRQLLYGNYRILFTVREKTVHVVHVRHGARRGLTAEEEE